MSAAHEALVTAQFGPRARAYVESRDHAFGADLERLAVLAAERAGGRMLDLGCGGGHVSFTMAPHAAEVVAYDLSPQMLDAVKAEAASRGFACIVTEQGRAEMLPFPDESFDLICTRYSAHHWGELPAALAEMRRVLKPDGLAVVMDTVSPEEPLLDSFLHAVEVLRDASHVRDYTPAEWIDALREAGLSPAAPVMSRLNLDFRSWIERIGTPDLQVRAIRALQAQVPPEVAAHYALQPDGSFSLDTMTIEAVRA